MRSTVAQVGIYHVDGPECVLVPTSGWYFAQGNLCPWAQLFDVSDKSVVLLDDVAGSHVAGVVPSAL